MEQTYLAIGGPLNGQYVTEDYAEDYIRFNSSHGEVFPSIRVEPGGFYISHKHRLVKKNKIQPYVPKCVLLYLPQPDEIVLKG